MYIGVTASSTSDAKILTVDFESRIWEYALITEVGGNKKTKMKIYGHTVAIYSFISFS